MEFINAKKLAYDNPNSISFPTNDELNNIVVGDYVQVSICKDKFWVRIEKVNENDFTGLVINYLFFTHLHGLECNDLVTILKDYILNISKKK